MIARRRPGSRREKRRSGGFGSTRFYDATSIIGGVWQRGGNGAKCAIHPAVGDAEADRDEPLDDDPDMAEPSRCLDEDDSPRPRRVDGSGFSAL